jgi:hypothetical protein
LENNGRPVYRPASDASTIEIVNLEMVQLSTRSPRLHTLQDTWLFGGENSAALRFSLSRYEEGAIPDVSASRKAELPPNAEEGCYPGHSAACEAPGEKQVQLDDRIGDTATPFFASESRELSPLDWLASLYGWGRKVSSTPTFV